MEPPQSSGKKLDCVCKVYVDGVELCSGELAWSHNLFEHITSQPGAAGWDLCGIELLLGYPFAPAAGQKVSFVREGQVLIVGTVPEIESQQSDSYWPLNSDVM